MYRLHPSARLKEAFRRKPFQGAPPEQATYLFVGLDANFSEDAEACAVGSDILAYLENGIEFWRKHGVHHPFLLPAYRRGSGFKYHDTFARIGFGPKHAGDVGFFELLHLPTVGVSSLTSDDLDRGHLRRLRGAIESGQAKHVFVSGRVGRLMHKSGVFPWMPKAPVDRGDPLKLWCAVGLTRVHWHYHFSVYGKFEALKAAQLAAIGNLLVRT